MNQKQLKNIIEAALMAFDEPLSVNQLLRLFSEDDEQPEKQEIRAVLDQLQKDYADQGVELKHVASGFRFQVRTDYAIWVNRLFLERPQRYSRAFMETLAIIAYRQPITRSEIEDIRGVSVNTGIIKSLQEREWIRVVGHRDVPGKPELLATTREFLDYFNLKRLSELPPLSEIKDYDQLNPDLFSGLTTQTQTDQTELEDTSSDKTNKDKDIFESEDNVVPFSS